MTTIVSGNGGAQDWEILKIHVLLIEGSLDGNPVDQGLQPLKARVHVHKTLGRRFCAIFREYLLNEDGSRNECIRMIKYDKIAI